MYIYTTSEDDVNRLKIKNNEKFRMNIICRLVKTEKKMRKKILRRKEKNIGGESFLSTKKNANLQDIKRPRTLTYGAFYYNKIKFCL